MAHFGVRSRAFLKSSLSCAGVINGVESKFGSRKQSRLLAAVRT